MELLRSTSLISLGKTATTDMQSFLARDMQCALYAIAGPSVSPSVTRVDQSVTAEDAIM